jgi:hypothetical protein
MLSKLMDMKKLRFIVNTKYWSVFIVAVSMLISCQQNAKQSASKIQSTSVSKDTTNVSNTSQLSNEAKGNGNRKDNFSLFELSNFEDSGDTLMLVSVSDVDTLSRDVDPNVIPDQAGKRSDQIKQFKLTSGYRKRLLKSTGISESDSLYIYDYAKDQLTAFSISSLTAVARLSPYSDSPDEKHDELDYMLGFQIDPASNSKIDYLNTTTLSICISHTNPFARGQMKPVLWSKANAESFPKVSLQEADKKILKGYVLNGTYTFQSNPYHFTLQTYTKNGEELVERLIILNDAKKIVYQSLFYEQESSSPAALSFTNGKQNSLEQWTGTLFKNKPPVILGFEYASFGCAVIPYIDGSNHYTVLNCDNRH